MTNPFCACIPELSSDVRHAVVMVPLLTATTLDHVTWHVRLPAHAVYSYRNCSAYALPLCPWGDLVLGK